MARSPSDLQLLRLKQHTEKDGTAHLLQSIHSQGVVTLLPLTDRSCFFLLLNYFSDSHMWDLCSLARSLTMWEEGKLSKTNCRCQVKYLLKDTNRVVFSSFEEEIQHVQCTVLQFTEMQCITSCLCP